MHAVHAKLGTAYMCLLISFYKKLVLILLFTVNGLRLCLIVSRSTNGVIAASITELCNVVFGIAGTFILPLSFLLPVVFQNWFSYYFKTLIIGNFFKQQHM